MRKIQLFCFTCVGGTADLYRPLQQSLKDKVTVIPLDYAGHGRRCKEKGYINFKQLGQDMYNELSKHIDWNVDYALMGYSMGCLAVLEILMNIEKYNKPFPVHIFLSAHGPNTREELGSVPQSKVKSIVKERVINLGGLPNNLVENECFWELYLPLYCADYVLIGTFCFDNLLFKTQIPTTVFYSDADTPYDEIKGWRGIFTGSCEFIEYEGTHFFIKNKVEQISQEIIKKLENKRNC